ncbi:thiol-disulfide isomerase/thioredoxin [Sphingomonas aerophila]|uniref:Thiol-disulfide isomerase/thioredoxin n=2 Tax=Sphingomonas aerophila TaxID=1344948 RepID=A0A7W9BG49_9SPHN|nr:TlpA disulfide reductase family protein [Sphingomonas aerophila]MBB5716553.1 thiol-disulfide isomerase/thioredoxin [Sphingomonas aerophila]
MKRLNMVLAASIAAAAATTAPAKQPKVGQPAPPVELTLISGEKVTLESLKGQVVVLNFWATWCVPCRRELPLLDAYYRKLRDRGLRIYAITIEASAPAGMKQLFAAMAIPSVRRIKGISSVVPAVPTNIIIDRAGVVRYVKASALELDDLNRELIPLLNEHSHAS